jgi:predicted amidohydrolase YtcJ
MMVVGVAVHSAPASAQSNAQVTVMVNGHIFTAEPSHPYADAIAIQGDRILAVGGREAVQAIAGERARRVDLQGRLLMPAMIDAHAHPIDGGVTLLRANYPDTRDVIPDLVAFVESQIGRPQSYVGDILVVYNVDTGYWPQARQIDAVLSSGRLADIPLVLYGSDGHTTWINRAMRTRAGLTRGYLRTLSPADLYFYGHDDALEPNGFVVDTGQTFVEKSIPKPSHDELMEAARAGLHYMNSVGITAWLDAAVSGDSDTAATIDSPGYLPIYRELAQHGELTAHVVAYPVVRPDSGLKQLDVVETLRKQYELAPDLRVPGLKVFADGVVEYPSQTAALSQPYLNSGTQVTPLFKQENMNALVTEADRRGLIVHVHVIGDQAVKASLDAIEAARRANPDSRVLHTLTHLQFVLPQDAVRMARLRVPAAVQLLWATADPSTIDVVQPYIDPQIYSTMYRARSLLEAGVLVAGSSDWPVSSANPFEAIYQAETRSGSKGVLNAGERMPREAMLTAYTRNAAVVLGELDQIGTLAPGKRADLVLVDRDVLTVAVGELRDAKVIWTMFGGRVVYGEGPDLEAETQPNWADLYRQVAVLQGAFDDCIGKSGWIGAPGMIPPACRSNCTSVSSATCSQMEPTWHPKADMRTTRMEPSTTSCGDGTPRAPRPARHGMQPSMWCEVTHTVS